MNLYNLTNLIKDICKGQPNVAQVEIGDVYAINHKQDVEYPAMVVTQQTSFVDNINKATTYNFTIFYIDLLDSSESNLLDVQSIATVAINDVLEGIEGAGLLLADTYEAHTFKERFNDVCAGAFVNVGIIVGNETCGGEGYSLVYSVNGQSGDVHIDLSDGFRIISAKARLQGDVNDDGYISITDETELSNRIRTGEGEWPEANYDVNLDGNVSIADMTLINNLILGRGELPLVVFDENPYLAVVNAFEDGKVPLVKATVGSKVYPMIVYKASSGLVNNDYTTYLSSAVYNDNLTMKVEYKEDSTYGVLSSNDIDLSNYYTKSEVDSAISSSVSSSITGVSLNGSAATVVNNVAVLSDIMTLPSVTSADNGKILMVVDGQWALVNPTPPEPSGYSSEYLTFVALEDGTFTFSENALQYSMDDGATWTTLASNTASPTVTAGNKIMWKQRGLTPTGSAGIGTFSSTGRFNVEGNVMSLYYGDDFADQTDLSDKNYAFRYLFIVNTNIVSAENLVLPAKTLAFSCYSYMFYGCSSLTTVPSILPSTTLTNGCYQNMFQNCTSLTTAPTLPATTLTNGCYENMFKNCTSLNSITCLATDISASNCTSNWVNGVAANGTFTKASSMTSWIIGASGIPNLWMVVNA